MGKTWKRDKNQKDRNYEIEIKKKKHNLARKISKKRYELKELD